MPSDKCVLITFDDGYTDNFEKAYPILKGYGMKATVLYGCSGHETKGEEKTEPNTAQKAAKQSKQQAEHDPSSKWVKVKSPARIPILMYHSISSGNSLRVPAGFGGLTAAEIEEGISRLRKAWLSSSKQEQ
ncbi:hypothetical protein DT075_02710 [Bacillus licheniformis]|nr:hypothetical protein DT075_02710 [Bacillus licheniformis]